MSITGYKRLVILFVILTLVASAFAYVAFTRCGTLDHKNAMDKLVLYETWRSNASRGDTHLAATCLEQLFSIGTFPTSGGLDPFVERERQRSIREVIGALRAKTGTDLGDDPQKWIEKYAR
jgi:hypothetical protein